MIRKTFTGTLVVFLLSYSTLCAQQTSTSFDSFHILVEHLENGIKMKCTHGYNWTDLAFDLKPYQP